MSKIASVSVQIGEVDPVNGTLEFIVDPWGTSVSFDQLKAMANGNQDLQAVIRNVCVMAGLAGVDVTDKAAMTAMLSGKTFKY